MTYIDDTPPASTHTPEPWNYDMGFIVAPDPAGRHPDIYIAEIARDDDEGRIAPCEQHEVNARRICAAVNACKGVSSEALERGAVAELRLMLRELVTAAGDLDAAIVGVTDEFDAERGKLSAAIRAAHTVFDGGMAFDLHELLACRGQIALVWSIEDVQEMRPDLTEEQAWQVLQRVGNKHDATLGVTWDTLEWAAEDLFGPAPETAAEEE